MPSPGSRIMQTLSPMNIDYKHAFSLTRRKVNLHDLSNPHIGHFKDKLSTQATSLCCPTFSTTVCLCRHGGQGWVGIAGSLGISILHTNVWHSLNLKRKRCNLDAVHAHKLKLHWHHMLTKQTQTRTEIMCRQDKWDPINPCTGWNHTKLKHARSHQPGTQGGTIIGRNMELYAKVDQ